jgi:hypothetical protein
MAALVECQSPNPPNACARIGGLLKMPRSRALRAVLLVGSFLLVAAFHAWPLPLHLSTRLTGEPGGDTGVYVWNTWVFRHELVSEGRWPLTTDTILPFGERADLSQHNYTIASDLVALPLLAIVDVVTAFNLVYLINVALAGLGVFLLARRMTAASSPTPAWLAGFLFACSPFLVARSTAHFSLVAAAALPFCAYFVDRCLERGRVRDAVGAGASVAWGGYSDPYYAVYAVLLAGAVVLGRNLSVTCSRRPAPQWARHLVNVLTAMLAVAIVIRAMTGVESLTIGSQRISMRTLYTPVLALTVLALTRLSLAWRLRTSWTWAQPPRGSLRLASISALAALVLLTPLVASLATRASAGDFVRTPVLWRSSAPGVDLAAFIAPNPNHPLAPSALVQWLSREPGQYEENVVSIPWIAMLTIFVAWRWAGRRPDRLWLGLALGSAWIALGPFVRVVGVPTFLPTPWTLVRYVPIVGEARMPPRFGVLVIMAVAVLFAQALAALRARYPAQARSLTWAAAAWLVFELLPIPRTLYSAEVPAIYDIVANDSRDVRVLDLPTGVLDGLSSLGRYTARSQMFQTHHGKDIVGGYLSRVSESSKAAMRDDPYLGVWLAWQAGRPPTDEVREAARARASEFLRAFRIGYVVIQRTEVPEALERFTIASLHLRLVGETGTFFLYVPDERLAGHSQ